MATTPPMEQAPLLGQRILTSGIGTAEQSLFLAGSDGAACRLVIAHSDGTAPGSGALVFRVKKSGVTTRVWRMPRTNEANARHETPGPFELAPGAEIRVAAEPGVASGAEIHLTAITRTFGSEFTYTPAPEE